MAAPARYFPVGPRALTMRARLGRFPTALGNGAADDRYLQLDDEAPRYRRAKVTPTRPGRPPPRERWRLRDDTPARAAALDAVRAWLDATAAREAPAVHATLDPAAPRAAWFEAVSRAVQEDLVVLHRGPPAGEPILMHVSFPSAWRPEAVAEADFRAIHGPVPGFADTAAQAESMVATMIERGPYLRFVWMLVADDVLDHHPDEGRQRPWEAGSTGYLRVERQITVPFPAVDASLFIIRTLVYPFAALTARERATVAAAIDAMPPAVRRYKGVAGREAHIRAALARAGERRRPPAGAPVDDPVR